MLSEKTLRRRAYNIGCSIRKGYTRCGGNISLDCEGKKSTGYMITDLATNGILAGFNSAYYYIWDLAEVENYLRENYEALGLAW